MPRRSSILDDLFAIGARLSWQAAIGLALLSFFLLNLVASHFANATSPKSISDLAGVIQREWLHTIASIFKFVVPAALLIGAAVSFVKRDKARVAFDCVGSEEGGALAALTWSEFEALIGEGFRRRGFSVSENVHKGPDGGIDLVLTKKNERALVQCKHWRRTSVGVAVIREFYGVMTSKSVRSGYVVTSGRFTPDAWGFAATCGIELMDGDRLRDWMANSIQVRSPALVQPPSMKLVDESVPLQPTCPACGADTILRTARQGKLAGKQFWGCARFPKCRGTVAV